MTRRGRLLAGGAALGLLALAGVGLAARCGAPPARCPKGAIALGPRCCPVGQSLEDGRCTGSPWSCPGALVQTDAGCVPPETRVLIEAGDLDALAPDWEAAGRSNLPRGKVDAFLIDAYEVTEARWRPCRDRGACTEIAASGEPGLPVRVGFAAASAFCAYAGGSLPTSAQHALAGAGAAGRRYPWGATGVVCRRAAFGLVEGPCGQGASGPEIPGMRPDGATPTGVHDLAGNVAEWARDGGGAVVRGGSFRSTAASALRTWSAEPGGPEARSDVGFRCAYPPSAGPAGN